MNDKLKKIITNVEIIGESFEGFADDFKNIHRYSISFENKVDKLLKDSESLIKWLKNLGDSKIYKNKKIFIKLIKDLQEDLDKGLEMPTIVAFRDISKQRMSYYLKSGLLKLPKND